MTTKSSKPKDYSRLDNTTTHWYVMLHRNPHLLDLMLKRENASSCSDQGDMRQIEYFIPYCFLSRVHETGDKTVTEGIDFSNQLREDFHDFAFFHTTERGIAMLLDREWNSNLRYHLRHFRDVRKNPVIISDAEMNTLIRVFSERKLRYTIGLPVAELSPDMNVCITADGPFNGQTARVVAVKHMPDGISLTLGVTLFQGVREMKIPDFRLSDIHLERDSEDIIGWTFIQTVEATLLDILSRRINHKETDDSRQQDSDTLNRLFLYSYITIADPAVSAYFQALMLICSTLRFDKESTSALVAIVKSLIPHPSSLIHHPSSIIHHPSSIIHHPSSIIHHPSSIIHHPSSIQATLYFALYIATRDANYRTLGKEIVQQLSDIGHQTSDISHLASVRRLMSLVSKLRSKRSRR